MSDLKTYLAQRCQIIDAALDQLIPSAETRPVSLHKAMRHSVFAGGKRLRPILTLAAAEACGGLIENAMPSACAVECLHTYSLIHDDLPCMDDADLRRGRPSCHKAFDEATALLAGDALIPLAFELLARGYGDRPALLRDLTLELAVTAGPSLLVGGQTEDMGGLAAGADPDRLEFILRGKTAAMLSASFAMGALVGGAASAEVEAFRRAGRSAGIAFQLVDDLLDLTSDSVQMGKPVGADAQNNKLTYAGLFGVPAAQARVAALTTEAIGLLQGTRGDTAFLVELVRRMAARRN